MLSRLLLFLSSLGGRMGSNFYCVCVLDALFSVMFLSSKFLHPVCIIQS